MDDFAALFTAIVLLISGLSFAALAGFIVWDSITDRRLGNATRRYRSSPATFEATSGLAGAA